MTDKYELLNLNFVISEFVFVSDATFIIIAFEKNENKSQNICPPLPFKYISVFIILLANFPKFENIYNSFCIS